MPPISRMASSSECVRVCFRASALAGKRASSKCVSGATPRTAAFSSRLESPQITSAFLYASSLMNTSRMVSCSASTSLAGFSMGSRIENPGRVRYTLSSAGKPSCRRKGWGFHEPGTRASSHTMPRSIKGESQRVISREMKPTRAKSGFFTRIALASCGLSGSSRCNSSPGGLPRHVLQPASLVESHPGTFVNGVNGVMIVLPV